MPQSRQGGLQDHPIAQLIAELSNAIVRPYVTMIFATAAVYFTFNAIIDGEFFKSIAAVVIGYYFGQRESEKAHERAQAQQEELVELAKQMPAPPPSS